MTFRDAATVAYSPYYNFSPFAFASTAGTPTLAQAPFVPNSTEPSLLTPGFAVAGVNSANLSVNATAGVSQALTRRSSIAANLMFQDIVFLTDGASDMMQLGSSVGYTYQIWRKLNFHAGFNRTQVRLSDGEGWSQPIQWLDLGLDYNDGLTFQLSRHTTLSLAAALGSFRTLPGTTQYRVLGNAVLSHTMHRTWVASTGVSRNLAFVAGFREPVLYDTVFAGISGQLVNRLSSSTVASLNRGYVGLNMANHYDTAGASSVLSFALTRRLAAFAQYSYYRNHIPAGLTTLTALTNFDRQSASVGLTLFEPIFSTARK
jgi:hypothetical protein